MKRTFTSVVAVVVIALTTSAAALAEVPAPVVPVPGGEPPAYDPTEPYQDDRSGRCPAGNTRMAPSGEIDLAVPSDLARLPGPVVPVEPAPATSAGLPCLAEVGLNLLVEAPDGKKPDGADGNLDGIAIPRSALEGGFEVTLPAQDRLITLSDAGDNWELKSTSCSCSGISMAATPGPLVLASAPGELASYPRPVVPVETPIGGAGGCSGASPAATSSVTVFAAPVALPTSDLATYPAPVIPVDPMPRLQAPRVEWDSDGTVTISDPDQVGGTFTCVWTVELVYGQLEVETVTKPAGEEGRFRYDVVPTGGQPDAAPFLVRGSSSDRLRWGPWSVDLADPPEGWQVKRSNCFESDSSLLSRASGSSASVGLDPDDAVRCRFEVELLRPKAGRWRASKKAGKVTCSKGGLSIPFDLSQVIDFGRLRVRDQGDTLVAGGGGNRLTFRRDRDDPLHYQATKRSRQGGFTLDFDIQLELRSETRMTGRFRAKAKGRGATCTARRPLSLTHASGG